MRIYTGIDIVSNFRVKKAYDKFGDKFLKKIYTETEIEYCKSKKDFIGCISARFSAKESVIKAFYKAFGKKLSFKDIEIYGREGKPAEILLHLQDSDLTHCQIDISISHENEFSVSVAIITIT